ncbi:MAG: hypothetical protein U5L00_20045 [Desulfovermiculus sp.]|nr:hypothetical protein [Desulfovermiculus sp.]
MADAVVTDSPGLVVPEITDDYVPEMSPVDPGKHVAPMQGPVDSGMGSREDLSSMSSTDPGQYEPKIRSFPRSQKVLQKRFERIRVVREFEGIVDQVDQENGVFLARLIDLTAGEIFEHDEGEFPIDDVRPDDLPLLNEGAVFRVRVAYRIKRGGTRQRFTEIIFRRLPCWNERHFEFAKQRAAKLSEYFCNED